MAPFSVQHFGPHSFSTCVHPSVSRELMGKQSHDRPSHHVAPPSVPELPLGRHSHHDAEVIIVGAGPSGLAVAACLQDRGVPFVILERSGCVASLWKEKTYDRLHMHIAKECCELPLMPVPKSYPTFMTRKQFIDYMERYASEFKLQPRFNEEVQSASFDERFKRWHVITRVSRDNAEAQEVQYFGKWLVVATGENAEVSMPGLPGLHDFKGSICHSSEYRNGADYNGKKVLVVGSGNSGMEIALDLVNSGAKASIVVRSPLHILPREILGMSTFSVSMRMMKSFPIWLVDYLLVSYSRLTLGDTAACGIKRPKIGPLELKSKMGKTPVLDVGTLAKIQYGNIEVKPAVDSFTDKNVRFTNGTMEAYDAVIFATGYKSNVPRWLKDEEGFFALDGLPKSCSPYNWKGKNGLYAAGLCKKGVLGAAIDAGLIAADIGKTYGANVPQQQ